jgi:hypothetical protein
LLAPAPEGFSQARNILDLRHLLGHRASDGEYLLLEPTRSQQRLPVVLIGGATAATPAAAVIPLDKNFPARAAAALHLWRAVAEPSSDRSVNGFTPARRRRLTLVLRALDAHLAGEAYRTIAQGLFGQRRVPSGSSWKTHDLRDRTIRMVRTGLDLMRGGYRKLLLHHPHKRPR